MYRHDLTIISSLYRAKAYYGRFVESVIEALRQLGQNGCSCEHLLIVNDPLDVDREAVEQIRAATADIPQVSVRPIYIQREGLYASWNRGVREAESKAVTFWNADDVRDAKAMLEGIQRISSGADIVYFDWTNEFRDPKTGEIQHKEATVPNFDQYLFSSEMLCAHFFMFRLSLFHDIGPFDAQLKIAADRDWCIRAFHKTNKVEHGDISGGIFSNYGSGLSTSNMKALFEEERRINIRHRQYEWIPMWQSLDAGDFQVDKALELENPPKWVEIPESFRSPIVPTPRAIDFYRNRGRLRYRMWTKFLWRFFTRYNLEKLRDKLMQEELSAVAYSKKAS